MKNRKHYRLRSVKSGDTKDKDHADMYLVVLSHKEMDVVLGGASVLRICLASHYRNLWF